MDILLIILFILQSIFNIYFLIKSIKSKDNRNWLILFSINISSIISVVLIGIYALSNPFLGWNGLGYLLICFLSLCADLFLLMVNSIFKIIEVRKNKKQNIIPETLNRNVKNKAIIIPLILITLSTLSLCGFDYSKYVIEQRGELNTYNNIKKKEINKMASFLSNKYNINIQENDCIYYREQDYTRHSDIFGNGSTYNIPYITVFRYNDEIITVADRKGFISDNRQLGELNEILTKYYYQKTGIKFDYIGFRKSYVGSWNGNDNIINIVLQTKFNELITDKNIEQFLDCILKESDLSISFYIKDDNENNIETLKYNIINELEYLREYNNIEIVKVYGYIGQLDIKYDKIEFPDEHKDYGNSSDDYYDGYKFGCYYLDTTSNNFTFSLSMDLNRGYTTEKGELINGWKYLVIN